METTLKPSLSIGRRFWIGFVIPLGFPFSPSPVYERLRPYIFLISRFPGGPEFNS